MLTLAPAFLAACLGASALAGPAVSVKSSSLRSPPVAVVQILGAQLRDFKRLPTVEAVADLEKLADFPKFGDPETDVAPLAANAYLAIASELSRAKPLDRPLLIQTLRVQVGEQNTSLLSLAALNLRKDPSAAPLLERLRKRYGTVFSGDPKDFGPALEKLFSGSDAMGEAAEAETPVSPLPPPAPTLSPVLVQSPRPGPNSPTSLKGPALLSPLQAALNAPTETAPPPELQSSAEREAVLQKLLADPRFKPLVDTTRQKSILPDSEVFVGGHAFVIRNRSQPRSVFKIAQRLAGPGGTLLGYDMNEPLLTEAANLLALSALGKWGAIPRVKAMGVNANGAVWLELEGLPDAAGLDGEPFASLPLAEKIEVLIHAARIYRGIHAAGWVHDDIKPDNILADAQGRIVVIDFGISKRRGSRTDVGTPGFAPQTDQIRDQDSDVYSFGKTLQALLIKTGNVSPQEALASGLKALIDAMTQEDRRRRRPEDMTGVMRALERGRSYFLDHPPAPLERAPGAGAGAANASFSLIRGDTAKVSRAEPALPAHQEGRRLASRIGVFAHYLDRNVLQQVLRAGLYAMAMAAPRGSAPEAALSWDALLWNGEMVVNIRQDSAQSVPDGLKNLPWAWASASTVPEISGAGSAGVAYASATRVISRLLPRVYPRGAIPSSSPTLAWYEDSPGKTKLQLRIPLLGAEQLGEKLPP